MFIDLVVVIAVVPLWVLVPVIATVVPKLVTSSRDAVEAPSSYSCADVVGDVVDV